MPLLSFINGKPFGKPVAGNDMTFDFPALIVHAAKTRALAAGTILGAGTVSNRDADGGPGKPISEGGLGYSCLAEQRVVETIRNGKPSTPFLKFGDRVRIEMRDGEGRSIFGAIDQDVVPLQAGVDHGQGLRIHRRYRPKRKSPSTRSGPASTPSRPRAIRIPASSSATTA